MSNNITRLIEGFFSLAALVHPPTANLPPQLCGSVCDFLLADVSPKADSITRLIDGFFSWAGGLSAIHYSFLFRALGLLGFPTLFCAIAFVQGNRSVLVQVLCFIAGVLLAASLPLHRITISNHFIRGWFLLLGVGVLVFLPAILPSLILPTLGMQKKMRVACYCVLGVLFLVNLIFAWSRL